jgi:hypothetical protein
MGWGLLAEKMRRFLTCVAREHSGGVWEALCLDFDIAVQGRSFDEVKNQLDVALTSYVTDAMAEDEKTRAALLNRRAPLFARISWLWHFVVRGLFGRNHDNDSDVGFQVACRA